ncbi:MAG: translation initiation factor IF-2, partial [Patescibacteria group bacterium]
KVTEGQIGTGDKIRVLRRGTEIVRGKIVGLEQQRAKVGEVAEGSECGILTEAKLPIAPGDDIECLVLVEK